MKKLKNARRRNDLQQAGYTITEALIFLAVSSLLAVSALTLMANRQRGTEFSQAIGDFESKLRDIGNDVSNGYFPNPQTIGCTANPSSSTVPSFSTVATAPAGTNSDCIFVGRVVQFESNRILIYNALGRRQSSGSDVKTIFESRARLIAKEAAADSTPEIIETSFVPNALQVRSVKFTDITGTVRIAEGVAFFSTFGKSGVDTSLSTIRAEIVPAGPLRAIGGGQYGFVTAFNDFYSDHVVFYGGLTNQEVYDGMKNAQSGVTICVYGQSTNQHANIVLGAKGSDGSSTSVTVDSGDCT